MLDANILGPGCANCYLLEGKTIATIELLMEEIPEAFENGSVTMQHLIEPEDFRKYGVLFTPGLVLNEELVSAGRLPSALEIRDWVMAALDGAGQTTDQ